MHVYETKEKKRRIGVGDNVVGPTRSKQVIYYTRKKYAHDAYVICKLFEHNVHVIRT